MEKSSNVLLSACVLVRMFYSKRSLYSTMYEFLYSVQAQFFSKKSLISITCACILIPLESEQNIALREHRICHRSINDCCAFIYFFSLQGANRVTAVVTSGGGQQQGERTRGPRPREGRRRCGQ